MTEEEWGPWVDHTGDGCPCVGMYVRIKYDMVGNGVAVCGTPIISGVAEGIARGGASWFWHENFIPVLRYRIRKPKALQQLREIAENVKEDA